MFSAIIILSTLLSTIQLKDSLRSKRLALEAIAYVFASAVADNIETRDELQIQRVLRSISRVPAILYVGVVDSDGATIAQLGNTVFLATDVINSDPTTFSMLTKGRLPITVNIIHGGLIVGRLALIANISDIRTQLAWNLVTIILAAVAAAVLAVPFAVPLLNRITRPIITLSEAMTKVRETRLYKSADIAEAEGETRTLVHAFNNMINDIRSRDAALQQLAYYDPLTGLPNRVHFQKLLDEFLNAEKQSNFAAVVLADIDNFHAINDAMGQTIGDALLMNVAALFHEEAGESYRVARVGGDEFAILLPGVKSQAEAQEVLAKFIAALFKPIEILGYELHVTASVGVVLVPQDGCLSSDVLRHLDLALYDAKQSGTGRVSFFKSEFIDRIKEEAELTQGLRVALANNEFEVHFQPIVSMRVGNVIGFEALARWKHPVKGYIPPIKFIPVAENSGLISVIGHWILRASCIQAKAWLEDGNPPRTVAVNISAAQILQVGFVESIRLILAETQLPPSLLCLELTESIFVGKSMVTIQRMLSEFKAMGIQTALDDFGTGYSSLSYLEHLPFDKLKIDRAFVRGLQNGQKNIDLMSGIIHLAHALGMSVVAEGAETSEEINSLKQLGADSVQGYAYAKPAPAIIALARANEIDGLLRADAS